MSHSKPSDGTRGETSYFIRLYRRAPAGSGSVSLAGIVERTDNGERAGFRTVEELWHILGGLIPLRNEED